MQFTKSSREFTLLELFLYNCIHKNLTRTEEVRRTFEEPYEIRNNPNI